MERTIAAWEEQLGPLLDHVAARQMADFGRIGAERKADGSLITTCDRWSDETVSRWLQDRFPATGVLSEEGSTRVPQQEWAWVLDPLDGTTNFTYGIPHWTISLALLHRGRPVMGWLEIPPLRQRIVVVQGEGVELNGRRLKPPTDVVTPNACASLCTRSMVVLQRRSHHRFPCKLRMFGVASTNMAGVALGQSLGALEASPKIWDLAAAWLVLEELGCPVEPLAGHPFPATPGAQLATVGYPLLTVAAPSLFPLFRPWAAALHPDNQPPPG